MNKFSLMFWFFILVAGVFVMNQVGQWAGGQSWYREETLLVSMLLMFSAYLVLAAALFEILAIILFLVGVALYVAIPAAAVFFISYFIASGVPTVKEMALLLAFIFIFSVTGGLIRQGQIDKRRQLPEL